MKKLTILLMSALVLGAVQAAYAAEQQDYASTIQVFKSDPVVAKFFSDSYGYAVFPTIAKAGFVVGGSYGEGQVYQGGKVTGTAKLIEGSIGWQFGGQAFSEIIFFQDKRAYDEFTSGNFEFSAGAEAVAITAGAQAQAGTAGSSAGASAGPKTGVQAETGYYKGIATFVHAKGGLMAGVSVAGQKFTFEPL
jgi:lipid-binding SYLF domain-containing protein